MPQEVGDAGLTSYVPQWFALQWTPELKTKSIQMKDLFPVVAAAALFGRQWKEYSGKEK